jgi:hypothetical protein
METISFILIPRVPYFAVYKRTQVVNCLALTSTARVQHKMNKAKETKICISYP